MAYIQTRYGKNERQNNEIKEIKKYVNVSIFIFYLNAYAINKTYFNDKASSIYL
jgi:hypothetical protein